MKRSILIAALLLLAGCASAPPYTPIVDQPGPNYQQDLAECQAHATEVKPEPGPGVLAVTGAAIGAAITGRPSAVLAGAAVGGVNGQYLGAMQGRYVVLMCLVGRGYRVLG